MVINEDGGSAVVTVELINEIENPFTLDYSTGEVPDGADGRYTPLYIDHSILHYVMLFNRGC